MKHNRYTRRRREELDRVAELKAKGQSVSDIARDLGRAKSSISELIRVNKDRRGRGEFRAVLASRRRAERRKKQRRKVKLDHNEELIL